MGSQTQNLPVNTPAGSNSRRHRSKAGTNRHHQCRNSSPIHDRDRSQEMATSQWPSPRLHDNQYRGHSGVYHPNGRRCSHRLEGKTRTNLTALLSGVIKLQFDNRTSTIDEHINEFQIRWGRLASTVAGGNRHHASCRCPCSPDQMRQCKSSDS